MTRSLIFLCATVALMGHMASRTGENLAEALKQAEIAEKIGLEPDESGEGNLLDVLLLQRTAISARSVRVRVERDLLLQRGNLLLGLGGSFE